MDIFAELISKAHDGAAGINGLEPPTAAQARSGNYKKGRITLHGMPIAIETPAGQRRTGKSDGQLWSVICMAHYGEFSGTKGADGDPIDVFVGPWPESTRAYIVNRVEKNGAFDEHKCLIGFTDATSAINAYRNSYERGQAGLSSFVPCSIEQLKWWMKFGDHSVPVTAKSLPHDGNVDMNETAWNDEAMPIGTDLPAIIYQLRKGDAQDSLLLDSVSVNDIIEDSDGEIALDALVIPMNRLERKMAQMQLAMKGAGNTVKPVAMQITPPFKQRGTTNVAVVYELSDGQTVSVFFHNPDSTPNKITPDDEMVSWKWLLNKKDVTILVAPEQGKDLNPREVARRVMRIAERNSARFQSANSKRAERMASIETMKSSVAEKEGLLNSLYAEIDSLQEQVDAKKQAPSPDAITTPGIEPIAVAAVIPATLQNEIRDENGEDVAGNNLEANGGNAVVQPQEDVGHEPFKAGERVYIKPEFQDRGDELYVRIAVDDEEKGRVTVKTLGTPITIAGGPTSVLQSNMIERRTPEEQEIVVRTKGILSPEGYAIAKPLPSLLEFHQDALDAYFQARVVDVRNAMREHDWFGTEMVFTKSGSPLRFTYDIASVGAGANVVGVKYQLLNENGVEAISIEDDLSKSPAEIATELNSADAVEPPAPEINGSAASRAADFVDELISSGWELVPKLDDTDPDQLTKNDSLVTVTYDGDKFSARLVGDAEGIYTEDQAGSPQALARIVNDAVDAAGLSLERQMHLAAEGYDIATGFDEIQLIVDAAKGVGKDKLVMVLQVLSDVNLPVYGKYQDYVLGGGSELVSTTEDLADAIINPSVDAGDGEDNDFLAATLAPPVDENRTSDTAFLQAVIDGSADIFDPSLADNLTVIFDKYQDDTGMMELFNQAAHAYSDAVVAKAKEI